SKAWCKDGSEVLWLRKQNGPRIADPLMEPDRSFTSFCFEIGCCISNLHLFFLLCALTCWVKFVSNLGAKVNIVWANSASALTALSIHRIFEGRCSRPKQLRRSALCQLFHSTPQPLARRRRPRQ